MFDVDKLKEALQFDSPNTAERQIVHDAARMVAAGQPLWWCEHHKLGNDHGARCDVPVYLGVPSPCRMVEGWWMPTGKDETS